MLNDKLDSPDEKPEVTLPMWLRISFFVVPLVGIIFFIVNFNRNPKNAKLAAQISMIGFFLGVLLSFFVEI